MPDLSDTVAKCRIGTAKNFTLLLLLYRTQAKALGHQLLQICSLIWLSAAFSRRLTWAWLMPISFATCV